MTFRFACGASAAALFCFTAPAVWADVTAPQVWDEIEAYLVGTGYSIDATETMSGDVLTLSDAVASMKLLPEGAITWDLSGTTLTENGDGTVSIVFPDEMPMNFDAADSADMQMAYRMADARILASGTVDDLLFDSTMSSVSFSLTGTSVEDEDITLSLTLANIAGSTRITKSGMRSYAQNMTADTLSYAMGVVSPGENVTFEGALTGVNFDGTGTLPQVEVPGDMAALLRGGLEGKFAAAFQSGTGNIAGKTEDGEFAVQTQSQGGSVDFSMDAAHFTISTAQQGAQTTLQSSEFPFPLSFSMSELRYGLTMPVQKSDAEQPWAFSMKLRGLEVADELWGLFDPQSILPRDPADLVIDLTGTAKLFFDMFDPEDAAQLETGDVTPGELNSVKVENLLLSVAGAKLTGTGDFTFDNSNGPGVPPVPVGTADLELVGANGLLDKLGQMGLVSDQDAMGARMMMGVIAVPGDGPDTLNSSIEMNDKGQIFANGQRLK